MLLWTLHRQTQCMPNHTPRRLTRLAFSMLDGEVGRSTPAMTQSSPHPVHSTHCPQHPIQTSHCITVRSTRKFHITHTTFLSPLLTPTAEPTISHFESFTPPTTSAFLRMHCTNRLLFIPAPLTNAQVSDRMVFKQTISFYNNTTIHSGETAHFSDFPLLHTFSSAPSRSLLDVVKGLSFDIKSLKTSNPPSGRVVKHGHYQKTLATAHVVAAQRRSGLTLGALLSWNTKHVPTMSLTTSVPTHNAH